MKVLIGAPDDRGVAVVGGRVGAKEGPAAIRRELGKKIPCNDAGDISIAPTQEKTYQNLREKISALHRKKTFPILLGGGHDLSFGSLSGFLDVFPEGGIINIDPHLDARPISEDGKISSGSAYRLLLEKKALKGKQLMEWGYRMECNQPANFNYLKEKGVQLVPWPDDYDPIEAAKKNLPPFARSFPALAVSFDMDSIQKDFAPGVSAPAQIGYTAEQAVALVQLLRQFPNLKQFEIMEVNPRFDIEDRTVQLAARLIGELLRGVRLGSGSV
ncbi:MAG: arginase family protein [bacterium]|nr:arginase family protein [bacterium]